MSHKILMLFDRYLPIIGGAETQGATLARELQRRGNTIHIITRRVRPDLPPTEIMDGIPVKRLSPVGLSKRANAFMLFRMFFYLLRHARAYDVLHVQMTGPIAVAALLAGKLLRVPVVLRIATAGDLWRQETGYTPPLYTRLIRRYILTPSLWRWLLKQASAIIALSAETAHEATTFELAAHTHLIPNAVNTSYYYPIGMDEKKRLRVQLGLPLDKPLILTTGRLVARKRLDVLLDAMPRILAQHPQVYLLLAGSGELQADSTEQDLKAHAQTLGISAQIIFLGNVTNVEQYLHAADIFAFPSEKEGMPNALLEAMACGLPCVASRIGGVVDVMDETMGWLITAGDVTALANALLTCLNKPDFARSKGTAAAHHIQSQFSLAAMGDAYEAVYQKVNPAPVPAKNRRRG